MLLAMVQTWADLLASWNAICRGEKRCILGIIGSVHGVSHAACGSNNETSLQDLALEQRTDSAGDVPMDTDQAEDPADMVELLVQEYHERQELKRALDDIQRERAQLEVQSPLDN